jgi:tRNA nucleotidyltransferase/poly(A) polymerase
MCTTSCVRPETLNLDPAAAKTLTGLFEHPIVRLLADRFTRAGGQLFVVGGPVRDALRGVADFSDLDFTTNLRPEDTKSILAPLGPLWTSGETHGTIAVSVGRGDVARVVEVTTFRTEVYTAGSRKPTVGFGNSITEDLKRRDLTVNAIAMNVVDGCLLDPFNGIAALAAGSLETPDDPDRTLSEDPLRVLRAIRFACRLNARLSNRLRTAVGTNAHRLSIVSAERKLEELNKLDKLGPVFLRDALVLAEELGVLEHWLPAAVTSTTGLTGTGSLDEVLAVLHHTLAPADLRQALSNLRLSSTKARHICDMVALSTSVADLPEGKTSVRRVLRRYGDDVIGPASWVLGAVTGSVHPFWGQLEDVLAAEPWVRDPLPVDGTDLLALGLEGRQIGAALKSLETMTCERGRISRDEALALATP